MIIILLFICGLIGANSELPAGVEKCKFGDNICITKQIQYIAQHYPNGDDSLKLIDLSPIKFDILRISELENSPVNIDLKLLNGGISGIFDSNFTKTSGFGKDLRGPHTLYFYTPNLNMLAKYKINGKVLILPIRGESNANLTVVGINFALRFEGKPLEKNGKIFLDVGKITTKATIKRMYFDFFDLFNDKALSDNMNKFLNENWEDIWIEVKPSIVKEFGEVLFGKTLKSVFDNNPYDELFLKE